MHRRTFLRSLLAAPLAVLAARRAAARKADRPRIAVVGAGAFGGWTALELLRAGARVTLLDAWGPGHSRASSGGETRVIRHGYSERRYVDLAARSLAMWREAAAAWERPIFEACGVLFMRQAGVGEAFFESAAGHLAAAGVPHERLDGEALARRYPQINSDGIVAALYEPTAGYLLARRACEAVVEAVVAAGGDYRIAAASPGPIRHGEMSELVLRGGETLRADQYVFACGPWLKALFPELLGPVLEISRQEAYYFGLPAGDRRFAEPALPVWADFGSRLWYGIPGAERRGFKIADDTRGPPFDPTLSDRQVSAEGVAAARSYIERRFPGLGPAPLIESRVCQYTNTPDGGFLLDRHPAAGNVWLVGGGSGHGFKHGPALGEMVAGRVLGHLPPEPAFALTRFDDAAG